MENGAIKFNVGKLEKLYSLFKIMRILAFLCFGTVFSLVMKEKVFWAVGFAVVGLLLLFIIIKLRKFIVLRFSMFSKFDPDACENYCKSKGILTFSTKMEVALYKGNLQDCVNYANLILNRTGTHPKFLVSYTSYLLAAFFIAQDYENLLGTVNKLEIKETDTKKVRKAKEQATESLRFYREFLYGNYYSCKLICQEIIKRIEKDPYRRIIWEYYLAVTLYNLGENDSASIIFEKLEREWPKNVFAKYSRKYLDAISNDSDVPSENLIIYDLEALENMYDYGEEIVNQNSAKRVKPNKSRPLITRIIILLLLVITIFEPFGPSKLESVFERRLEDKYEAYEILKVSELEKDGKVFDGICIYTAGGGNINVAFDGGVEPDGQSYWYDYSAVNLKTYFGSEQEYTEPEGEFKVTFAIRSNENEVPENADFVYKIKLDDRESYFYAIFTKVKSIEPLTEA